MASNQTPESEPNTRPRRDRKAPARYEDELPETPLNPHRKDSSSRPRRRSSIKSRRRSQSSPAEEEGDVISAEDAEQELVEQDIEESLRLGLNTSPTDPNTLSYGVLASPTHVQDSYEGLEREITQNPSERLQYAPFSPIPFTLSTHPSRRPSKKKSAMPTTTAVKRIKGQSITRPFIIGSEAWPLDETKTRTPSTPESHTKGWVVYIRPATPNSPPLSAWLKKVSFKIYHTYENPTRVVEGSPYEVRETGWGGFQVEIRMFFVPEAQVKPEYRSHFLQLEPYGDEEMVERQKRELMVRSEFLEVVEFNEPTEALWDILTSEKQAEQPVAGGSGKGGKSRGKGKGRASISRNEDVSVELPEMSSEAAPFSKETERLTLEMLAGAERKLDELIKEETKLHGEAAKEAAVWRDRAGEREKEIANGEGDNIVLARSGISGDGTTNENVSGGP